MECSSISFKKDNLTSKECLNCRKIFNFKASPSNINRKKFCSNECKWGYKKSIFNWEQFKCSSDESFYEVGRTGEYSTTDLGPRALQHTNKKNFNHDFFSKGIIDENTAYVLGLMISDGSVSIKVNKNNNSKTFICRLEMTDKQIIDDVSKILKYKNTISITKKYNKNNVHTSTAYKISMTSYKIFQDLMKLGCVPNKTFIVKYPVLNTQFDRHFIRGLIDGDGSFFIKDNQLYMNFVGTDYLCRGVSEVIKGHLNLEPQSCIYPSKYNSSKNMNNFCSITYNHNNSLKIHSWLYEDSSIYLKRKRDKIEQLRPKATDYLTTPDLAKLCNVSVDYIKRNFEKVGAGKKIGRIRTFTENDIKVWQEYIKKNKKRHIKTR